MSVSGRAYKRTRPRGHASWSPRGATLDLLDAIGRVLDDYADHLPITARQVFYRLVVLGSIEKAERDYGRLVDVLGRARRARRIPMEAIRDDGVTTAGGTGWSSPERFLDAVVAEARGYVGDLTLGQPVAVEVWVEAAGMVPQVVRVADDYGIRVHSSSGFDSITAKHDAARRVLGRSRPTVVLHVGDHDPSGCSIVDSAAEDVTAFARDLGSPAGSVRFARLAVTPDQIARHDLPTAPQKATDTRGDRMAETVQAEALPPDVLAQEVRDGIEAILDLDALGRARAASEEDRVRLVDRLADLDI